ncbi:MAG: STAS domain-containing protein [Lachnospiraceae bacterium]|nr:STAS domain-containing protein [Lachnospiraceae bacterium]
MEIGIEKNENTLEIKLTDRLDTVTSPQLEEKLREELEGVTNLQFDFAELEYVSSAGLRVLLTASKKMKKQGKMEIHNVNEEVMEVFTITGFADILTIL